MIIWRWSIQRCSTSRNLIAKDASVWPHEATQEGKDMDLKITEQEKDILLELIESAEQEAIQGMDHADSRSFKELLKNRLDLLASMKEKIRSFVTRPV